MKLQELNKKELITISGGSEASDSFCYIVGFLVKGLYYIAKNGQGNYRDY